MKSLYITVLIFSIIALCIYYVSRSQNEKQGAIQSASVFYGVTREVK